MQRDHSSVEIAGILYMISGSVNDREVILLKLAVSRAVLSCCPDASFS